MRRQREDISSAWIARAILLILLKSNINNNLNLNIQGQALSYLTELWTTYLCRLASVCSGIASGSGRSKVQFNDLIYVFASCSISSSDLWLHISSSSSSSNDYESAPSCNQIHNINTLDSLGQYIPILSPTFGFLVKHVPASCLSRIAPPHTFHPLYPVVLSHAEFPPDIITSLQNYTGSSRYKPSTHSNPILEVHVPRLTLPSHIPSQCPKFPPPHTYRRTSSIMPLHAPQASRALLLSTERSVMATNIQKFLAISSALPNTNSFMTHCENSFWLSSCTDWICASVPTNWWVEKSQCDAASVVSSGPCETRVDPCETPAAPCETPVGPYLHSESATRPCDTPNLVPNTTTTESNAGTLPDQSSVFEAATELYQSPSGNQSEMDIVDVSHPTVIPNWPIVNPIESTDPVSPLGGLKIRFRVGSNS